MIDINAIAIDNVMTSINSVNSSMIPETIYNNTDDTDLTLVPTNNTPSHQSYDASFNEDNNDNVYLGVEKSAENDQSDTRSNDDSESQSIDMNATTIDNDASDNVATRTRSRGVRLRAKAREERARLEKARKRLQRIPGRNLESVESSSNSPSYEY